jgi:Bacterial regulatory proteins, luxR family
MGPLVGCGSSTESVCARIKAWSSIGSLELDNEDSDSWVSKASMPVPKVFARSAHVVNGEIDAIGGEPDSTPVLAYHLATDTWSKITNLPVPNMAVGTVKSHLHNILQKLDAKSRTQAVARARDLQLL